MRSLKIKTGIKVLLLLSATYIAVSIITGIAIYYLIPIHDFTVYPVIGLFYLVTGVIMNYSLIYYRNTTHVKLLNVYMGGRMIKLFLTILFLILFTYYFSPYKKAFALTTITYYFIFSGLELFIYSIYNRRLIKHEQKHQKPH